MSRRRRPGQRRRREAPPPPPSRWSNIRSTIDSFGGFLVLGAIVVTVVVLIVVVVKFGPTSPSEDPLAGEAVQLGPSSHVDPSAVPIGTLPQAGGPHASSPLRNGIYEAPIQEGNAIHAMEHGVVWVTYQPNLLTADEIARLTDVANDFRRDVILAPRLENVDPIVLVSWGRRLILSDLDEDVVADFIRTNRNRSPEPGIR